ncbi:methylated-DNA--[protein]-cysteine S-methyltransferase [Elusimicrobiota bacterium]
MPKNLPKNIKEKILQYPKFARQVWLECFNIPKGTTISYKELAIRIGHAKSARAVGSVLRKNPFAPIIPCHRVIKSDGTIGKYSAKGGVKEKLRLINCEKK